MLSTLYSTPVLVFTSLKHSLLPASKSYCYGWKEPRTRTRCSDRNIPTIQQSESCCHTRVLIVITARHRFIDSEADLDAAIKALLPLAQVPKVAYPLLIGSGQLESLVGLLSHENADIALDVIELIHELTDEDVGEDVEDEDERDPEQREAALRNLIGTLVRPLLFSV
jgi:hypothetical protein